MAKGVPEYQLLDDFNQSPLLCQRRNLMLGPTEGPLTSWIPDLRVTGVPTRGPEREPFGSVQVDYWRKELLGAGPH